MNGKDTFRNGLILIESREDLAVWEHPSARIQGYQPQKGHTSSPLNPQKGGTGTTRPVPSHECINCGYVVYGYNPDIIDGLRCDACCGGPLVPIARYKKGTQPDTTAKAGARANPPPKQERRIERVDGLTANEGKVMDALIDTWNAFNKLERQHPGELKEFTDGVHKCQDLLALRVVRRCYPLGWPVK